MTRIHSHTPGAGVATLMRSAALGAVVAQVWQAAGTFALQILAAHLLGAEGLGTMSLCLGIIFLTAAVASGLVGDSLTVLNRSVPSVRAGLQGWALVLGLVLPGSAALALLGLGLVEEAAVVWFGAAAALFLFEELLRRLLMASMQFWRLVAVDTAALVLTLATLFFIAQAQPLTVSAFLAAVAVGQMVGLLAAVVLLPGSERWIAPMRGAGLAEVARFGTWRGMQVAVNPGALTALRLIIVATSGAGALGALEAARILVAPATLIVQGLGSYLLASYARDRSAPLEVLVRRATRASIGLAFAAVATGGLAALLIPFLGDVVSGGNFAISPYAVLAWAGYAAAIATVAPFASLGAARGRQRAVLGIRVGDSLSGLALTAVALGVLGWKAAVAPLALALGLLAAGVLLRSVVLGPLARTQPRLPGIDPGSGPSVAPDQTHTAAQHRDRADATPVGTQ